MSKVLQHKVVAALPSPLEPDSIYYVRKADGFDIYVTNGVGVVTAYSLNANLELDGKVDKTDARLTDSREWSEETVTQAEAEAGTASTRRAWTSQRVRQAINAWWQLVTSGFGRNFIAASNEQAARNALQLTYPATASTVGEGDEVMRSGAYGLGYPPLITNDFKTKGDINQFFHGYDDPEFYDIHAGMTLAYSGDWWSQIVVKPLAVPEIKIRSFYSGTTYSPIFKLYHTGNLLNIGTTPSSARTALQLTGEWVDLRPYLKSGFYWDPAREGKNPHPQIRKLSCGRVELDGIVSFNATSGPIQPGIFVNVPAEFRPTLTVGGLMFGDTASPLSFGACNWIVIGQVEYSPPAVHGDISAIPLTLASPAQDGALSLNGIYWFT